MPTPTLHLLAAAAPVQVPLWALVVGIAVGAAAWAYMFLGSEATFWRRAATSGLVIAAWAVAVDARGLGRAFTGGHEAWPVQLAIGLVSGVVLYAVFWVGEQLLVVVAPTLADEVADLYTKRGRVPRPVMILVLAVAGPAEEIFFRGLLWARGGVVLGLVVYAAVHVWERKVILVLAALAGGAWWGGLYALTGGLVAPVASHLLWCLLIIAWRPARPTAAARRFQSRLRPADGQA